MSTVSIHVVTYNNAATIEQCLRAAQAQRDVTFTLTVIDNASTDHTAHIARSLNVDLILNAENRGYAAAHNQAIAHSDSPYILTLNPDVVLAPDFLTHCVAALEANAQVGAVAGCLLRVDHLEDEPRVLDSTGLIMRRNRRQGLKNEGRPVAERPLEPAYIFGPDGAAAVYRRAMLEDIAIDGEIFDEDFFMHKEDVDLCWRAQWRGWKARYVPAALARHVRTFRPGQRRQVDDHLRYLGFRNRYLLMLKNESRAGFFDDGPWILFYDLAILAYALLFERHTLTALASVWKLRHKMGDKRKRIQTSRQASWQELKTLFRG